MNPVYKIFTIIILLAFHVLAQTIHIKGTVLDNETGEAIEGVDILVSANQHVLITDQKGNFNFPLDSGGKHQITFSRIGYKSYQTTIEPSNNDMSLEIRLIQTEITLGQVTVTSTKYSKLERDVAFPLEVVTSEKLGKNLAVSVSDILKNEPGISLVRDGIWSTDISIRGLSRQNIVTLVDGNRIETATNLAAGLSLIDMFDIQRIEVIKGGVSSLYGTGATGGVINVTTKTGSYTDAFQLSGSLSSGYNSVNEGGVGNLSLISSNTNWILKLNGSLRSAINTQTPQRRLPNSQFRDNYLSGSAALVPFENQELKLSFQNFSGKDIGIPGGKSFPQTAVARYLLAERKMYSAEYRFKNIFPSLVTAAIKYFYQGIERNVELKPNASTTVLPGANHSTNGIQIQTNWLLDNYNQIAAGLDFWQRTYSGFRETIVKSVSTTKITADYPVPNSKYLSTGLYAQNESRMFADRLSVTVGGRFDLIKVTNDETRNPAYVNTNGTITYPPQNPLASFSAGKYSDQSWSGNLGLLYSITKILDVAFNFAHAFRSPVLEERFQYINLGGDIYIGNPNLESERGNFIDASIRIWDDNISLKSNFFYNTFNNLVIDKPIIIDSLYQKANVGKARLFGFDFGMEFNLINTFILSASASYVRGEDTENKTDLPQIPPFNGRVGFKSSIGKYVSYEIASTFFISQNNVAFGERTTPGYVLFDLFLSSMAVDLSLVNCKFFAGIENIFDKGYRNHLSTNRGLILSEPGRNFFIRTSFTF